MKTENNDITAEEVMEYAKKCSGMIQNYIAKEMKKRGLDDLNLVSDVPQGIPLSNSYLTTPNKEIKNFIARMTCAINGAWCSILEQYSEHAISHKELSQMINNGTAEVHMESNSLKLS